MIGISTNPNLPLVIPALQQLKDTPHPFLEFVRKDAIYDYRVGWMYEQPSPACLGETGFFFSACHFDPSGLFTKSCLRGEAFRKTLADYKTDFSGTEYILYEAPQKSKFYQPDSVSWDGVVFATQVPKDRSITTVGTQEQWWRYYEGACHYYRDNLFVKIHPWVKDDVQKRMEETASKYGCSYGKVGNGFLRTCKFVVMYNSTYCVDCFLHGARVVQGAPGYFSESGSVFFTTEYPDDCPDLTDTGRRLVDWLGNHYCLHSKMPLTFWEQFFIWRATNKIDISIPHRFSYFYNARALQ